ncbi:MAG: bifunctional methylenetetrahydrofolate dehydrogenase/methenyltetrahydrofolate cyclohydrolase [Leptospiraceae bacterium]|nr:bifunctional methylenetetrahydrofolate dehydrogenase/methenyltetrahydrofolate cyclohydrolase [Leptospiraceae bacterium]MCP5511832.1 bifunctional methylenetetrahydrofolate dehydrogenase/methenyltetrahydrofolate cyclohydrolase [Leptospiraceae bacterium]
MSSTILDGKKLSEKMREEMKRDIAFLQDKTGKFPTLATILVGENPSSKTYVNMKVKSCGAIGMGSKKIHLPEETTTEKLLSVIDELNSDPSINGILLQHPSPPQVDERKAFDRILPEKDVDGVTTLSFGQLSMGEKTFYPCTPYGIILLLEEYNIPFKGKNAVVVGRSPILGKPMAMLLLEKNCTVTICHSHTQNLPEIVRTADIIVGAVGRPEFIKGDWIKEGAVVVDAGYNEGNVGDIDLPGASLKSSFHTPVPGGVGPMTITVLLKQTLDSFKAQIQS